jgi:hypothetical protein
MTSPWRSIARPWTSSSVSNARRHGTSTRFSETSPRIFSLVTMLTPENFAKVCSTALKSAFFRFSEIGLPSSSDVAPESAEPRLMRSTGGNGVGGPSSAGVTSGAATGAGVVDVVAGASHAVSSSGACVTTPAGTSTANWSVGSVSVNGSGRGGKGGIAAWAVTAPSSNAVAIPRAQIRHRSKNRPTTVAPRAARNTTLTERPNNRKNRKNRSVFMAGHPRSQSFA